MDRGKSVFLALRVEDWLVISRALFLTIHIVGIALFAYIVVKRSCRWFELNETCGLIVPWPAPRQFSNFGWGNGSIHDTSSLEPPISSAVATSVRD